MAARIRPTLVDRMRAAEPVMEDLDAVEWYRPIRDYIWALECEVLRLAGIANAKSKVASRPDDFREEPVVGLGDGGPEGLAPARDDGALVVVENLEDPPRPAGAEAVEIEREPEGLFDATGVEDGEKFGGFGIDGPGGHGSPETMTEAQDYHLTQHIQRILQQMEEEFAAEAEHALRRLMRNDFRDLVHVRQRWKMDAIRMFASRLMREFSAVGPRFAS